MCGLAVWGWKLGPEAAGVLQGQMELCPELSPELKGHI